MTRLLDIVLSVLGLAMLLPLLLLVFLIGLLNTGAPLFMQERVGRNKAPFVLVKFRTMRLGTESVATHLADPAAVTAFGRFLRKTKLDELPQLWNVIKGDMSLVGPRPCLPNQTELIAARKALGVFNARPGITGLAQVQGIDMSNPGLLAQTDAQMLAGFSVAAYWRYLLLTLLGRGAGDRLRG
jgi:O-antigen biosynthesis protein WbqP